MQGLLHRDNENFPKSCGNVPRLCLKSITGNYTSSDSIRFIFYYITVNSVAAVNRSSVNYYLRESIRTGAFNAATFDN